MPEAAEGEAPQPGYIEGPTREREFTLKGEASLTFKVLHLLACALTLRGHTATLWTGLFRAHHVSEVPTAC